VTSLLCLGGLGLASYLWLRPQRQTSGSRSQPGSNTTDRLPELSRNLPPPGAWGWPVPRWQGRAPVISDGYGTPRPSPIGTHRGVDLMFARAASDPFPATGPDGSKGYVMPPGWLAVAAADGHLWSAGRTPRGYAVTLDHGDVSTYYTHLSSLLVPEAAAGKAPIPIQAGQPLGVIGADPLDAGGLRHLHFEFWSSSHDPTSAIDPRPLMAMWRVYDTITPMVRNARKPAKRPELVHVRAYDRAWPGTALPPSR